LEGAFGKEREKPIPEKKKPAKALETWRLRLEGVSGGFLAFRLYYFLWISHSTELQKKKKSQR